VRVNANAVPVDAAMLDPHPLSCVGLATVRCDPPGSPLCATDTAQEAGVCRRRHTDTRVRRPESSSFFGLVLGVGISYGVGRAIASLLYQIESHDLVTLGTVPIVFLLIAVVACALPAYRASRVEPMKIFRTE
jgi:hypothetical protein